MKITDIIFALIAGRILGFLIGDFLREWGINIGLYWALLIWLILPIVSLACLWLAYKIGRKMLFVFQGAKFFLVGAVATVFDLKIFEFLLWLFALHIPFSTLVAKSASFIISTFFKYWGNKHWAFSDYARSREARQKHEKEDIHKEIIVFFSITLVGLAIDVMCFYYFLKVMGPQFGFPEAIWVKFSVIFAALIAALWNFLGYKFFVFKK